MNNKDTDPTLWVIDRFEANCAILISDSASDTPEMHIKREFLPVECNEGDCLLLSNGTWFVDVETTARRRSEMQSRLHRLFDRGRRKTKDK